MSLPRTLDRPEAKLPVLQTTGRLGCPMDFMNSTGVLFPMALFGRSPLFSLRKTSHLERVLSSDRSATIRYRRAFSSSSCFNRRTSDGMSPAYFFRHR